MTLTDDQVIGMFAATDRADLDAVCSYFHDDVEVRFGNQDPVRGKHAYTSLYREFSSNFQRIRHEIHDLWHAEGPVGVVIAAMTVHYTRHDGVVASVPCCNVLRIVDGLIRHYEVYLDVAPAFVAAS